MPSPFTAKFRFNFLSPVLCLASLHPISQAHTHSFADIPQPSTLLGPFLIPCSRALFLVAEQQNDVFSLNRPCCPPPIGGDKQSMARGQLLLLLLQQLSSGLRFKLCFGAFISKMKLRCCIVCRLEVVASKTTKERLGPRDQSAPSRQQQLLLLMLLFIGCLRQRLLLQQQLSPRQFHLGLGVCCACKCDAFADGGIEPIRRAAQLEQALVRR